MDLAWDTVGLGHNETGIQLMDQAWDTMDLARDTVDLAWPGTQSVWDKINGPGLGCNRPGTQWDQDTMDNGLDLGHN